MVQSYWKKYAMRRTIPETHEILKVLFSLRIFSRSCIDLAGSGECEDRLVMILKAGAEKTFCLNSTFKSVGVLC